MTALPQDRKALTGSVRKPTGATNIENQRQLTKQTTEKRRKGKLKKILFSIMAVVAAIGLIGGAFAYFTDVESSTDNS